MFSSYEEDTGTLEATPDDVDDYVAEELDADVTTNQVGEPPVIDSELIPDLNQMRVTPIADDDENITDDKAEQDDYDEQNVDTDDVDDEDTDPQSRTPFSVRVDNVSVSGGGGTDVTDYDTTDDEEDIQDIEFENAEITDVESDIEESEDVDLIGEDLTEDIDFTEESENDTIFDYGFTDTNIFENEADDNFEQTADVQFEGDMRHGERNNVEASFEDGEWLQDESDLSDADLGAELQLQFDSLSEINTPDVIQGFNFDDAGEDFSVMPELEDLQNDDPMNMLDDLDADMISDVSFTGWDNNGWDGRG